MCGCPRRVAVNRRSLLPLVLAAFVLCGCTVAACGGSGGRGSPGSSHKAAAAADRSPINVALVTFKIPALDFISDFHAGAEAALRYIDSRGGWGGRKLNLIACNSMLAQAATSTCAHKMVADHVVGEFGCETSWTTAGLPLFSSVGIPSFNCTNGGADLTNRLSFGMASGGPGEQAAMAKWLCLTQPKVKRVVFLAQADPEVEATVPPAVTPALKSCGKTIKYTYFPLTAVDMTPFVAKVLSSHPQWVMTNIGQEQMVQVAKALQQQGFPSNHLSIASNALDVKNVFEPAGSALSDVYASDEWTGWGLNTSDAAIYRRWMHKTGAGNPLSGNDVQGWMYMMWIYTAAKHIGFDKFNAKTLASWLKSRQADGLHIPMSRSYVLDGPAGKPAIHQPYVQILHWKNNKMTVAQGEQHGWIRSPAEQ